MRMKPRTHEGTDGVADGRLMLAPPDARCAQVLHVTASPRKPRLLPPRQPVPRPEWLVLGGLVFCPLLPDYEGLVPKCQLQRIHAPPTPELEQVVVLLRVLQSEVNIGCAPAHTCVCLPGHLDTPPPLSDRPPSTLPLRSLIAALDTPPPLSDRRPRHSPSAL